MTYEIRVTSPEELAALARPQAWLCDMDGVLIHESVALPGAKEFIHALESSGVPYLVLTNNSIFTRRDLSARLATSGLEIPEDRIWTSAAATADFLASQSPGGSAYVIGEAGLTTALHQQGFVMTDSNPEFVVLGETRNYSFSAITQAIRLIEGGAKFIATNPDVSGPSPEGTLPATGSVAALVTTATNRRPYFVGKPNPIMIRAGLNRIGAHSETTAFVGDRMDTDMRSGLEAGLQTHLVLTGSTGINDVSTYPFRPVAIHEGIGGVLPLIS
ncbi:HAD-IIA family hydrolase [Brooklawnia sp.]|uniref:HAD-IIA family hydrolase n=1 Tax=Brooklawnia sp. TaxID=2699740 RepID=UPI00311F9D1B